MQCHLLTSISVEIRSVLFLCGTAAYVPFTLHLSLSFIHTSSYIQCRLFSLSFVAVPAVLCHSSYIAPRTATYVRIITIIFSLPISLPHVLLSLFLSCLPIFSGPLRVCLTSLPLLALLLAWPRPLQPLPLHPRFAFIPWRWCVLAFHSISTSCSVVFRAPYFFLRLLLHHSYLASSCSFSAFALCLHNHNFFSNFLYSF